MPGHKESKQKLDESAVEGDLLLIQKKAVSGDSSEEVQAMANTIGVVQD